MLFYSLSWERAGKFCVSESILTKSHLEGHYPLHAMDFIYVFR